MACHMCGFEADEGLPVGRIRVFGIEGWHPVELEWVCWIVGGFPVEGMLGGGTDSEGPLTPALSPQMGAREKSASKVGCSPERWRTASL